MKKKKEERDPSDKSQAIFLLKIDILDGGDEGNLE
jgi:hypothetical protein